MPVETLVERAAAFARALPQDVAFSHGTAALLLGIPMPDRFETSTVLDVMRDSCRTPIRRELSWGIGARVPRGCRRERCSGRRGTRHLVDLGDLVARGLTVEDLVVAGDHVVNRLGLQGSGLIDAVTRRCRPRGAVSLDEAAALVRPGVRSPMESRARVMFVRAGFPEPEVNADVFDRHGGWLLEGDLVWRRQRVIGEYQGVDHGSIKRRSADASRVMAAEAEDYRILEIYSEDVYRRARRRACLTRFARALQLDLAGLRLS